MTINPRRGVDVPKHYFGNMAIDNFEQLPVSVAVGDLNVRIRANGCSNVSFALISFRSEKTCFLKIVNSARFLMQTR